MQGWRPRAWPVVVRQAAGAAASAAAAVAAAAAAPVGKTAAHFVAAVGAVVIAADPGAHLAAAASAAAAAAAVVVDAKAGHAWVPSYLPPNGGVPRSLSADRTPHAPLFAAAGVAVGCLGSVAVDNAAAP